MNVRQFLARQLNDHTDSPSGVIQPTYTEWTEQHITDALELGVCYLFSLVPQEFASVQRLVVAEESCVVEFKPACEWFTGLVNLQIGTDMCVRLHQMEKDEEHPDEQRSNSLMDLLGTPCGTEQETLNDMMRDDGYYWDEADGSKSVIKFNKALPVGSILTYTCATPPTLDTLDNNEMCQYHPLIADYALWWLYRTDTESRSNLARADMHFKGVQNFVETKMLVEFSLREDDFDFGRRKVDNNE